MLLIDGVKYELWTPTNEDEFERVVAEHTQEIFGEHSLYFDRKQKLRSLSGVGSIPDGYVIVPGGSSQWHIVEVELSSHPLHDHIVSQVGRFISAISNPNVQRGIANALYEDIDSDDFVRLRLRKAIEPAEIYRFLIDLVSKQPVLTVIIEENTEELKEALNTLRYPQIKVVEFQTLVREGASFSVHAHLFEPLYGPAVPSTQKPQKVTKGYRREVGMGRIARRVTFEELIQAHLVKDGQVLKFYNTRLFPDERAKVMASSNELKYEGDDRLYSKSELAKILLIKHGFKHDEYGVRGPKYWQTEDGTFLKDLEEQVRIRRGDRG
jgi:hypothetical protein